MIILVSIYKVLFSQKLWLDLGIKYNIINRNYASNMVYQFYLMTNPASNMV